ncbi:MAG: RsmB/NOP family class I SAM-dependent RNA methyltransferase [Cyanobacteria bacterium REEB459]|nr:RsmB/NOP family class I SAM-dependent RNA methyltransferase [Cyanobacteria bacterium REEB459]
MAAPSNLLLKLSRRLFKAPEDQTAFVDALIKPACPASALVWMVPRPEQFPFSREPPLPWQPAWVDRLSPGQRPGQHPLHGSGAYYCLDLASVFTASVLTAIQSPLQAILDLCAAPGGKSLLARQMLQPDYLWCNETVGKRVKSLIANLKRCGVTEARVFNLDPQVWAAQAAQALPLVIVDAPCSGQSLLTKGRRVEGCFHPVTIGKNAQRQRRILAQAAQLIAPGGYLAYMTCTFSPEENEAIASWLLKTFPQFEAVEVTDLQAHTSHLAEFPCYRLWPQSGWGAGGFTALLRNRSPGQRALVTDFIDRQGMKIYGPS